MAPLRLMRPWTVLKRTVHVGSEGTGRAPITARISLARAQARADSGDGEQSEPSFNRNLSLLLPPVAMAWVLLYLARWRYSDAERLRAVQDQPGGAMLLDFLGWRVVAHLGPYQIPNFVQARLYEAPLKQLTEPLLLDHERATVLSRLETITQRRLAATSIAPVASSPNGVSSPFAAIEPVLVDLFGAAASPESKPPAYAKDVTVSAAASAASHKAAEVRIFMDLISAVAPNDRVVPPWVLSGLVNAKGSPWQEGPQGEELRVTLLAQLLACPANCESAVLLSDVCNYVQQLGFKSKEDTIWPLKAFLLSGETPDLIRRCGLLIVRQCPGAVEVAPRRPRDTPNLQVKRDLRNFWTTALLTAGWAGFSAWRGKVDMQAALAMGKAIGSGLGAMSVMEFVWRVEEYVIQSPWYFDNGGTMLAASAGMCLTNAVAFSWALRFNIAVPFLACRIGKDNFMDAYRSFEL